MRAGGVELVRGTPGRDTQHGFTIPLAPGGTREMVLHIAGVRIVPPKDAAMLDNTLPSPATVRYVLDGPGELAARPIEGNTLGDPELLTVDGRGTCEVGFDGPM